MTNDETHFAANLLRRARLSRRAPVSTHRDFAWQDVGWVERSEAHRAACRWASHGSTHPTPRRSVDTDFRGRAEKRAKSFRHSGFVIRHSFVIRISSFVIHSPCPPS